jgi:pilus assembly protein CpaB
MSRRRRAAALLGLSALLGGLAASDVARREAAVRAQLGPAVPVVVARAALPAGRKLAASDLAVRDVPARFAPAGAARVPELLVGQPLATAVPRGGYLGQAQLAVPEAIARPPVRAGERAADVVALGAPDLVVPGARVDVLVTRDGDGGAELALEDVEVLAARRAPPSARDEAGARVAATLRVSVRDAVFLAAAQSYARELRLLPRAAGDRERAGPVEVGPQLR